MYATAVMSFVLNVFHVFGECQKQCNQAGSNLIAKLACAEVEPMCYWQHGKLIFNQPLLSYTSFILNLDGTSVL